MQLPREDKEVISFVIENNTDDDIRLQNRTILGSLYAIDAVENIEEKATPEVKI